MTIQSRINNSIIFLQKALQEQEALLHHGLILHLKKNKTRPSRMDKILIEKLKQKIKAFEESIHLLKALQKAFNTLDDTI